MDLRDKMAAGIGLTAHNAQGLRLFLSFHYIIHRILPFVLMFVDSWMQRATAGLHIMSTLNVERRVERGTGRICFILSGK